jgi:predicted membrane protein
MLLFFVLGDILGAGIYVLVGKVAGHVGGMLWLPFLLAFVLALLTAAAYSELAGKYSQAAGAALYINKAFGIPFVTFIVAFAVMMSGVTSAGVWRQISRGVREPADDCRSVDISWSRDPSKFRRHFRVRQSECDAHGHRGIRIARHYRNRHLRIADRRR